MTIEDHIEHCICSSYLDICTIQANSTEVTSHCVHEFNDISEQAYGAVLYVVTQYSDDTSPSHLIVVKTRVTPPKSISIPMLELCSAALLVSLINSLLSTITIISVNL